MAKVIRTMGPEIIAALPNMSLAQLALQVRCDWRNVNYGAAPYLQAMATLDSIDQSYGYDSGKSVVLYFLANAQSWRGPTAKLIKAELKRRCK